MNYKKLALTVAAGAMATTMMAQSAPQLNANNIEEVIKAMTLEEKAQLLVGGGNDGFVGSGAMLGHQKKFVPGAAGTTVAIPRLGIPTTVQCDGPAGVHIDAHREGDSRSYFATGFPIGTCLASTWNTDLVRKVGEAIGNETLEYGCDVVLGPGMNLHRNPLCGRNFEYYSEDPIVTGLIGTAFVQGVQSQGVGVSAKHFAVNSQETDRTKVDERLSQRALRELYLKGFEMMVRKRILGLSCLPIIRLTVFMPRATRASLPIFSATTGDIRESWRPTGLVSVPTFLWNRKLRLATT